MKKIKSILILFLWVGITNQSFAQKLPFPYSSPEAASLGIVGNIPVSLYTGRANITVPLTEVQSGGYRLPVALSYNSSGVIPDLRPGWVGQNWSLSVGGAITRSVKGLPDETDTYGFCKSYNRLQNADWASNQNLMSTQSSPYFFGHSVNYYDTEPDEFSFGVDGISGKFYIGSDGKFKVASEPGIKVECDINDLRSTDQSMHIPTFWGFKIITPEGIVYHFGFKNNAIETSNIYPPGGNSFANSYASSWLLTKIEIPNRNEVITFTYDTKKLDLKASFVETNVSSAWQWSNGKWTKSREKETMPTGKNWIR